MTNTTHTLIWRSMLAIASITFISACASVPPIMHEGRTVNVIVRCEPNIQPGMKKGEVEDRTKVAEFTETDLVERLSDVGCNARVASTADSCVTERGTHLLTITINELRVVGDAAQFWVGAMAGASWVNYHYELSGEGKRTILSYDNSDGSIHGWQSCVEQLDEKAADKITGRLRAIYGSPVSATRHP